MLGKVVSFIWHVRRIRQPGTLGILGRGDMDIRLNAGRSKEARWRASRKARHRVPNSSYEAQATTNLTGVTVSGYWKNAPSFWPSLGR